MALVESFPILRMPNKVLLQVTEHVPPLVLPIVGKVCGSLRQIETEAWSRHVPPGLARPQHNKQLFAARFDQLRAALPYAGFAQIAKAQSSLATPPSIFDETHLPLAALKVLHATPRVGGDTDLARTLTPRLLEALGAIAAAMMPTEFLSAAGVLAALVETCPALPAAADALQVKTHLGGVLDTLKRMLALRVHFLADARFDYQGVFTGCLKTVELLAPCLDAAQVVECLGIAQDRTLAAGPYLSAQEPGLDALAALLRRVRHLPFPKQILASLRYDALRAIALPHTGNYPTAGSLRPHAWRAMHAWVGLITEKDDPLVRVALKLTLRKLSLYDERYVSTETVRQTVQALFGPSGAEAGARFLQLSEKICINLASRHTRDKDELRIVLSSFKVLCLAAGGVAARQAMARMVSALPKDAEPVAMAGIIACCAVHFDSATARTLWATKPVNIGNAASKKASRLCCLLPPIYQTTTPTHCCKSV